MSELNQILTCILTSTENPKGPVEKFHAEGKVLESHPSIYIQIRDESTSNFVVNGNISSNKIITTRSPSTYSDIRLKANIDELCIGLDVINKINAKKYYYKKMKDSLCYGYIAQELEEIIPDIVETDNDNIKHVHYIELIPIMCNAIKELNTKIQVLSQELIELRNKK